MRALCSILLVALAAIASGGSAQARELKVCADPNNLPFSNENGEGFENKIVELIAHKLGANLTYAWWAERRGFVRNTLNAGLCDLVPGTAIGVDALRTTLPYYRSGYVFVTKTSGPNIASLDDPKLNTLKIGVQLVGNDGANPPPAMALARRGIIENVRGFSLYGDYSKPNPPAAIMQAVADGDIDVAIVWGPLAGYFASREKVPLRLAQVEPEIDGARLPMVFDITMGVRWDDEDLKNEVDAALVDLRPQIDAILAAYGVPRLDETTMPPTQTEESERVQETATAK